MFTNKIINLISLKDLDADIIEINDEDKVDYHQTILNIGYGWWNGHPNPNNYSFADMIEHMNKSYGIIYGTLVLIGKLNQQVNNGGFLQYYNNGYTRKRKDDFGQSLHTRIIVDLLDIIAELENKDILTAGEFSTLKEALRIFQAYLNIPVDTEKSYREEVEYEEDGEPYFQVEDVENDDYGHLTDTDSLDILDGQYYDIDEALMEVMNKISKLCFADRQELLHNQETEDLLVAAIQENKIEEEREEWDDEMTISDRIDSMVDPEMNIEKIVEMITDSTSLSYTKGESLFLINKFIENFNKEYMIIKKDL